MKSRESCIVITTTDSEDIANKIAGKLVEQRLAACVQIDKVKSFFYY
ncbi:MAG: divalent-cation tolerance protein CutA, partial [Rickettsiaceae bacterium]|nr:divalent-cation tolerance protein CutA [Rickettsiaceae bacterium]